MKYYNKNIRLFFFINFNIIAQFRSNTSKSSCLRIVILPLLDSLGFHFFSNKTPFSLIYEKFFIAKF